MEFIGTAQPYGVDKRIYNFEVSEAKHKLLTNVPLTRIWNLWSDFLKTHMFILYYAYAVSIQNVKRKKKYKGSIHFVNNKKIPTFHGVIIM